jgi:glycerol-3-phosphate O-acyltransferase
MGTDHEGVSCSTLHGGGCHDRAMKKIPRAQTVPSYVHDARFRNMEGVLDAEPPWLLRKLIPLLSANVTVDPYVIEQIRESARRGPIVYAMKYRNVYDLHFLRMRFAGLNLPLPAYVFGMPAVTYGSLSKLLRVWWTKLTRSIPRGAATTAPDQDTLQEILEKGGAGVMFLADEKTFRERYVQPDLDPLQVLLNIQGRVAGCVSVVPLFILYDRRQRRAIRPFWESFLGDPDRPGPLKRILLAVQKRTIPEVLIGQPVPLVGTLEEFGSETPWDELPFELRNELIANINARIRVNRGPERLTRTEIKERVLRDVRVQRSVRDLASTEKTSIEKVRKQAEDYAEEIAADARLQAHVFFYYLLKWIFSKVFDGIDLNQSQFSELKRISERGSLIFVPCHKSHFDYLVIPFLTFINNMAVPNMAAGKNLAFWPLGTLLRRGGAFFLRRSFKGMGLYTNVFAAYLKVLVREKYGIKFYMEGGRSRTGKLMPPRVGMLTFLVRAVEDGTVQDLTFVPTFMGYDRIPEEKSYLREQSGQDKKQESLLSLVRAREVLGKRYGKVYVRFDEPVSFRAFCEQWRGGVEPGKTSVKEGRQLLNDFAYHLMFGIVRAGVVTAVDLAAAALMAPRKNSVTHTELMTAARLLVQVLHYREIELAENLDNLETGIEVALEVFSRRGFVEVGQSDTEAGGTVYRIDEQQRANLDFYRNSLVNYLWSASFLAIILKKGRGGSDEITPAVREEFLALRQLFSKELITDPLKDEEGLLEETFELFRRNGWLPDPQDEERAGKSQDHLEYLRGFLADLIEAYYLVLDASEEIGDGMSQREFTKAVMKKGRDLRATEESDMAFSVSSITISNALATFHELGILTYRQSKKLLKAVPDSAGKDEWKERLASALGRESYLP